MSTSETAVFSHVIDDLIWQSLIFCSSSTKWTEAASVLLTTFLWRYSIRTWRFSLSLSAFPSKLSSESPLTVWSQQNRLYLECTLLHLQPLHFTVLQTCTCIARHFYSSSPFVGTDSYLGSFIIKWTKDLMKIRSVAFLLTPACLEILQESPVHSRHPSTCEWRYPQTSWLFPTRQIGHPTLDITWWGFTPWSWRWSLSQS